MSDNRSHPASLPAVAWLRRLIPDRDKPALRRIIDERLAELEAQGWKPDPAKRPKSGMEEDLIRMRCVRAIVAVECRKCTKSGCRRRTGPCRRMRAVETEI